MDQTLVIPEQLIEKEQSFTPNPLNSSNFYQGRFDILGSNGIFEVNPSILYFSGFEIRKQQTKRLLVKNVSSTPQRLSILPTSTAFFRAQYNKRGQLAPGMSQEIFVRFTPSEWRYHFDCVRILSPRGNLNVPIHAYPVMNQQERYIPPIIDLGKCVLGEKLIKHLTLHCNIPVTFEYEIRMVKQHNDFIIGPPRGDVPGNGEAVIEIIYEPRSASTATCEVEFKLSEFDYQPLISKVIASATHSQPDQSFTVRQESESMKSSRILLKTTMGRANQLPKLDQKNATRKLIKTVEKSLPVIIDRAMKEQAFNTGFRKLEDFDREKEFKIHRSIGNPHPDEEFVQKIFQSRADWITSQNLTRRKTDLMREDIEKDRDKAIYDISFQLQQEPTWDYLQNDQFSMRQLPLNRFLKIANRVMVRLRAQKRLNMLKQKLKEHGVTNNKKARKFIDWDWKQADLIGLGKADFIPFDFDISQGLSHVEFPIQFEDQEQVKKAIEDIKPIEKFDKLQRLELIEAQDFLENNLPDFTIPPASYYLPQENKNGIRKGAEEEYQGILQKGTFEEYAPEEMPSNILKPEVIDPVSQVRPHPTLRPFLNVNEVTETRPEIGLLGKQFPDESLPEYPGKLELQQVELANKWLPQGSQPIPQIPKPLVGYRASEVLSDSDSDSGNVFHIEIPDLDSYMQAFEEQEPQNRTTDDPRQTALSEVQQSYIEQREKEIAKIPNFLTDANRLITTTEYKLAIY